MRWAWVVILLAIYSLTPHQQGAAQAKEYVVWMVLPATGQADECYDTIPGPEIHQLEWLRIKGWCFNQARCDTFNTSVGVDGMEGDSIGVGLELPPGAHGEMWFRAVNPIGESCIARFVFAVSME